MIDSDLVIAIKEGGKQTDTYKKYQELRERYGETLTYLSDAIDALKGIPYAKGISIPLNTWQNPSGKEMFLELKPFDGLIVLTNRDDNKNTAFEYGPSNDSVSANITALQELADIPTEESQQLFAVSNPKESLAVALSVAQCPSFPFNDQIYTDRLRIASANRSKLLV